MTLIVSYSLTYAAVLCVCVKVRNPTRRDLLNYSFNLAPKKWFLIWECLAGHSGFSCASPLKWGVLVLWISWKYRLHNGIAAGNKKGCLPVVAWPHLESEIKEGGEVQTIRGLKICLCMERQLVGAGSLQVALGDTRAVLYSSRNLEHRRRWAFVTLWGENTSLPGFDRVLSAAPGWTCLQPYLTVPLFQVTLIPQLTSNVIS